MNRKQNSRKKYFSDDLSLLNADYDYFISGSDMVFSDEFFDDWREEHDESDIRPEYVWGTTKQEMSFDAYDIVSSACEDILLYETEGDTLKIVETTLTENDLKKAAWILLEKTNLKKVVYSRPGGMLWIPEDCELSLQKGNGYFNLCLGD